MSRDAERLQFLARQLADLRAVEPTIPRGPRNAYRIGLTRKNIARVEAILRDLAARIIEEGSRVRRDPPSARGTITNIRPAGPEHQVVTVEGNRRGYRREPCPGCPWRVENDGSFPAEAFRHSARTAYDLSTHVFACHESGVEGGHTCAGFLLRGAAHNMAVRLGYMRGDYKDDVTDGGAELHESYRAMAIANGVDEDDPVLRPCRP